MFRFQRSGVETNKILQGKYRDRQDLERGEESRDRAVIDAVDRLEHDGDDVADDQEQYGLSNSGMIQK